MRPGPIGPGIPGAPPFVCIDPEASMRPGPIGPGIDVTAGGALDDIWSLQ